MLRNRRVVAALAGALALAAAGLPARAAGPEQDLKGTVDEQKKRIDELEKRLKEMEGGGASDRELDRALERYLDKRRAAAQSTGGKDATPDDAYLLGSVERPSNPRFRFGGYATVLYRSPDDPDNVPTFEGLRVVPQFVFDVSPGIEFATEIEFERGGIAEEFLEDSEVLVEYAEARFKVSESFVPKAGILLIPFLRYNLYHDDPMWNLQDRPFTARRIFKVAFQQPGVGAEGVFRTAQGHSFNYNVALSNGIDDEVTNEGFEDARQPFGEDNNRDKTIWARLGATPRLPFVDAADFGVSFARGALDPSEDVKMFGWGVDGKVTRDRFDLIFEWVAFDYDRPATQPAATFPHQTSGAFVQLDTHLLRGLPKSANGIVGPESELILAARYEWCDTNERVTGAAIEDDCRAIVVGLAFRFTPKTVFRVERRSETTSFDGPGPEDLGQWVISLSTYF